jgi:hypothetical protein
MQRITPSSITYTGLFLTFRKITYKPTTMAGSWALSYVPRAYVRSMCIAGPFPFCARPGRSRSVSPLFSSQRSPLVLVPLSFFSQQPGSRRSLLAVFCAVFRLSPLSPASGSRLNLSLQLSAALGSRLSALSGSPYLGNSGQLSAALRHSSLTTRSAAFSQYMATPGLSPPLFTHHPLGSFLSI